MFRRPRNARNTRPGARVALVRAIAGLPVAMRQTRRGSFLIMVVGTLALLAIITIVYVSIGRSDRQTSMAALKHDDRRDIPDQLGAYISSVIADDLFDTVYFGERNPDGDPIFRREAWDYPSTAYTAVLPLGTADTPLTPITIGDGTDARFHFTPTGNGTGADPYLASSEPCLLDFDGSALTGGPNDYFLERLDWLNISNFAPDGSFVNLFNLRGNTSAGRSQGNFDATPWEMRGESIDNRSAAAPLTLFGDAPATGNRNPALDYGGNAVDSFDPAAVPAQMTRRQRWLVHPGADPAYAPGAPEYMLYQYADADGDGILDSRWFELVEDRDPADTIEHWLIERDDDMRYFFAVRAIDLSGRINVNTATDSTLAPLAADPLGVLPGGVDIRRFLTLEDFYTDLRTGFAYDGYIQPTFPGPNDPSDPDPANYAGYTQDNAYAAGEKAYDSLRMVLDTGLMPDRGWAGLDYLANGGVIDREFSLAINGDPLNPYWATYWKTGGAFGPSEYYSQFAGFGAGGGGGYTTGGNLDSGLGRSFTADSLLELLTRNGVNDNRTNSPLEIALSGRGDPAVMGLLDAGRFGPLRDNRRTDSIERLRGGWALGPFQFYDQAKAALYTDIRQRLTTLSGGRPILASPVPAVTGTDFVDAGLLALDKTRDTKRPISKLFPANATGQELFELYAAALSPYSDIQQHWDPGAGTFDETRTLYYGNRGPYLALQTAGFLAVNMLDAYDDGDIHTKRTILFNGSDAFRSANNLGANYTGDRTPEYPWKLLDLDPDAPNTPYPKLWDGTNIAGMPEAVNVFGIEAQPFITEAASFVMYTDTPDALGGDDDSGEGQLNGERFWRRVPSINGEVPSITKPENPDFLFELLAFQVHNPFDESITLSGEASGDIAQARRDLYYIQYGDLYIKFTDVESGTEQEITLGARQTKTLYVLTQHPDAIAKRINTITQDAAYGGKTLDEEKARIRAWINRQLGPNAVMVAPFDPGGAGSARIPDPNVADLRDVEDLQKGSVEERRIVRLWRVEKPEEDLVNGGFEVAGVDETTTNDVTNDTLIDRMREPIVPDTTPILDRRLWEPGDNQSGRNGEVNGAEKGPEPPDGDAIDKDNRGLSITRFSVVRRNGDTNAGSVSTVPRGGFPAYCIEVKDQSGAAANEADDDGSAQKRLDINDFNGNVGDDTLNGLMGKQGNSGDLSNRLVPTISTDPEQKYDDPKFGLNIKQIPSNLAGIPFEGGLDSFGNLQPPLYVEPSLNNDKFEVTGISTMRVADLLLPLGIGPHQIPLLNGVPPGDEDIEWTTLSEALAIALAYDQPPVESIYRDVFFDSTSTGIEPLLDRACLRYDAFVPFIDNVTSDGLYTAGEPRWGLGIPAAANIFDAITTLPPKFGSIDTVTHGQININTASRETLRALPALSPPSTTNPDGTPNWWWTDPDVHDWRSDIATTIFAYCNKLAVFPRDVTGTEPAEPLNFRDWWDAALANRLPPPAFPVPPGESPLENARWGTTGVAGIHESLGIRSIGELAFIRDWGYPVNAAYPLAHDIDRLGYDQSNLDAEGVDSVAYDYDGDGNKTDDDEIDDDFSERLALANAVMASSSVRSDVFAVWFIVHGYRESDVKGLGVNDPMVPSVARRFVMVVDRSNVTKPGDEPRIVLFKEVPL